MRNIKEFLWTPVNGKFDKLFVDHIENYEYLLITVKNYALECIIMESKIISSTTVCPIIKVLSQFPVIYKPLVNGIEQKNKL